MVHRPRSRSRLTHTTPAGFPSGIPGSGDDIDNAMQHAAHPGLQFISHHSICPCLSQYARGGGGNPAWHRSERAASGSEPHSASAPAVPAELQPQPRSGPASRGSPRHIMAHVNAPATVARAANASSPRSGTSSEHHARLLPGTPS